MNDQRTFAFTGELSRCNHGDTIRPYRAMVVAPGAIAHVETEAFSCTASRTINASGRADSMYESRHGGKETHGTSSGRGGEGGGSFSFMGIGAQGHSNWNNSRHDESQKEWSTAVSGSLESRIGGDFSTTESGSVTGGMIIGAGRGTERYHADVRKLTSTMSQMQSSNHRSMIEDMRLAREEGPRMLTASSNAVGSTSIQARSTPQENSMRVTGREGGRSSYVPRLLR